MIGVKATRMKECSRKASGKLIPNSLRDVPTWSTSCTFIPSHPSGQSDKDKVKITNHKFWRCLHPLARYVVNAALPEKPPGKWCNPCPHMQPQPGFKRG